MVISYHCNRTLFDCVLLQIALLLKGSLWILMFIENIYIPVFYFLNLLRNISIKMFCLLAKSQNPV